MMIRKYHFEEEQMLIRVIDCETCGKEPDIRLVEVGWTNLVPIYHADDVPHHWEIDAPKAILCDPGVPIDPESCSIHHIVDAMVSGMWTPKEAIEQGYYNAPREAIIAAHYADGDRKMMDDSQNRFPWIDTYKVAVHLARNAPAYKLQVLRYWLKLDIDPQLGYPAHRAGPDSYVTAVMLMRMLTKLSPQEMIDISSRPAFLPRLFFGKHTEMPIAEVPSSYLNWILSQHDKEGGFSEDIIYTAKRELQNRNPQQRLFDDTENPAPS